MTEIEQRRRSLRVPLGDVRTEMVLDGAHYPIQVQDLSQDGMRIVLQSGVEINPDAEVKIAIGKISPNVRGRVRWVSRPDGEGPVQLGVEFESFVIEEPAADEVEGLLEAWKEISRTYSVFESFLHILHTLDSDIVEGRIDDLSEVLYSITVWLDEQAGPLNLWGTLKEPGAGIAVQPLVIRHPQPAERAESRAAHVRAVAEDGLTGWFDGRPYLYGGNIVIEYLGDNEGQVDLLQRLTVLLAKRIGFWSRLLMKNIALQLFGEQLERLRRDDGPR